MSHLFKPGHKMVRKAPSPPSDAPKHQLKSLFSPPRAVREYCLGCAENSSVVRDCPEGPEVAEPCPLWGFRMGKKMPGAGSRLKAIRAACMYCMNGQQSLVRECDYEPCALWPFRSGHRPKGTQAVARPVAKEV